ncbi:hypothetical protein [Moorena producens]|uniref:hypothetical protein n=1 Tax=Moorena producens TaxID=1155739 RepID=UPI003C77A957
MGRWGDGEWASWWNWHLASFNIFSGGEDGHWHLGRTGILVELASWWNWHLGGTGILPVSISFRGGRMATGILVELASW